MKITVLGKTQVSQKQETYPGFVVTDLTIGVDIKLHLSLDFCKVHSVTTSSRFVIFLQDHSLPWQHNIFLWPYIYTDITA